jgi:hypothetical protein
MLWELVPPSLIEIISVVFNGQETLRGLPTITILDAINFKPSDHEESTV